MADALNDAVDTKAEKKRLKDERKKIKDEQKAQKKEAKQRAKEISAQEAELEDEGGHRARRYAQSGRKGRAWLSRNSLYRQSAMCGIRSCPIRFCGRRLPPGGQHDCLRPWHRWYQTLRDPCRR